MPLLHTFKEERNTDFYVKPLEFIFRIQLNKTKRCVGQTRVK